MNKLNKRYKNYNIAEENKLFLRVIFTILMIENIYYI